jgi:hypothetical protein
MAKFGAPEGKDSPDMPVVSSGDINLPATPVVSPRDPKFPAAPVVSPRDPKLPATPVVSPRDSKLPDLLPRDPKLPAKPVVSPRDIKLPGKRVISQRDTRKAVKALRSQVTPPTRDEIQTFLEAITAVVPVTPAEPSIRVELGIVVEQGKKSLVEVGDCVHSGRLGTVSVQQLEDFVDTLFRALEKAGAETAARAAGQILRDRSSVETMRMLAEDLRPLVDVASQVAAKMEPTDRARRSALRWWILAGALLLAAILSGFVPLLGVPAAEAMMTNELALAAVAASLGAWLGKK